MKKYIRSRLYLDERDMWLGPSEYEWDYDYGYIYVDLPTFVSYIDANGMWDETGDEVYTACLNATIDNPTKISNAEIREDLNEKLGSYIDEKIKDLRSQNIKVSGEVSIQFIYPMRAFGKHEGEINWDECEIESFDFSKVIVEQIRV